MKKIFIISLLLVTMMLSFTACKVKNRPQQTPQPTTNTNIEPEQKKDNNVKAGKADSKGSLENEPASPTESPGTETSGDDTTAGDSSHQDSLVSDDFFMPVEDVFSITGRGTVVTGHILTGHISTGAEIELVGLSEEGRMVTAGGIEMFRKITDHAQAGDNVGIILEGLERTDVERGQAITAKGNVSAHKTFSATLNFEEGVEINASNGVIKALCYFFTTDTTSTIYLDENPDNAGSTTARIELLASLPMKEGTTFTVRHEGKVIASGEVTALDIEMSKKPVQAGEININASNVSNTSSAANTSSPSDAPNDQKPDDNGGYSVTLVSSGSQKIKLIKAIRDITGLGLAEAKALVDNTPSVIKTGLTMEQAQIIKDELDAVEATAEVLKAGN
ncbi:MAG: ribosomal protein L7/L12 [Thermoclostridium sp.]|nr:ribosomal protein L7/L12 [Thermoclostridium sp.]